jgi:hypothetical protein
MPLLAEDEDEPPIGTGHARDPTADTGCWCIPRWPVPSQPCGSATVVQRWIRMGWQAVSFAHFGSGDGIGLVILQLIERPHFHVFNPSIGRGLVLLVAGGLQLGHRTDAVGRSRTSMPRLSRRLLLKRSGAAARLNEVSRCHSCWRLRVTGKVIGRSSASAIPCEDRSSTVKVRIAKAPWAEA